MPMKAWLQDGVTDGPALQPMSLLRISTLTNGGIVFLRDPFLFRDFAPLQKIIELALSRIVGSSHGKRPCHENVSLAGLIQKSSTKHLVLAHVMLATLLPPRSLESIALGKKCRSSARNPPLVWLARWAPG